MVCTLAVTQALNRHRKTQLFLQRDSAAPTLKYRRSLRTRLRVCACWTWTGRDDSCKCRLRLQQSALDSFSATKWRQGPRQRPAPSWRCGAFNHGCAFPFLRPKIRSWSAQHSHSNLTDRPASGCSAAPSFGSLGSAAKVNNECIFLHIFKMVTLVFCFSVLR